MSTREIPLTRGMVAVVDEEDYESLSQFKWCVQAGGHTYYAGRNGKNNDGKAITILMHRVILDAPDGMDTDHIDGNGLNNTRANLRLATRAQNCRNQKNVRENGSSRYKGVYRAKWIKAKPWRAEICVNYRHTFLGYYRTQEEAAEAYNQAALRLHGEFARLNKLPEAENLKKAS